MKKHLSLLETPKLSTMVLLDRRIVMFYLNIFFIYSILGFLFENIIMLISNNHFFNSGVLYGPWAFIYGIAIFILMLLDKLLKEKKLPKWLEIVLYYIGACLLMTLIEFIGGNLIEKIFHVVYWDYTNMAYNFGHYICLEISLFWGLFATLVNYLLTPLIKKFEKKIPWYVTIIITILFIIDIIATIIN